MRPLIGLLFAFCAFQFVQFKQHYIQVLSGGQFELRRVVDNFDNDNFKSGYTRSAAFAELDNNSSPIARDQSRRMKSNVVRVLYLQSHRLALAGASPLADVVEFALNHDPELVGLTRENFHLGFPTGGIPLAAIGFALPYVFWLLLLPFRARRFATA